MADGDSSWLKRLLTSVHHVWNDHPDAGGDEAHMSPVHAFIHFWVLTVKSFGRNRVPVRAAALAYSSLLALVPILALVLTIAFGFLRGEEGQKVIQSFIHYIVQAVVPSAGGSADADKTVKAIQEFVKNQQTSAVSTSAALMLVFIAIMMLARIEDTFNDIWGVSRGRNWIARVTQYWATLTLGPVLLVVVIGLTSSTELESFKSTLAEMPLGIGNVTSFFFKFLPFGIVSVAFAGLYALLPATKVHWKSALIGGIVGGTLWQLNNLLSVLYVSRVVTNNKVYGSLGMVPVLMVGLYFSWIILLFGAQVAYSYQNRRAYFQEKQVENLDQQSREFIALRLMTEIGRRFHAGEKPATGVMLSEQLGVPTRLTGRILQALIAAGLLVEGNQGEATYLPARPLERITCHDILQALRTSRTGGLATLDDAARERVRRHYERFQEQERAAANQVTLASLVAGDGPKA
jgi:membrane protein